MLVSVAYFNVIIILICRSKSNQIEIILTELNPTTTGPNLLIDLDMK